MTELKTQIQIFSWARDNQRRYPCLQYLHCTLNGLPAASKRSAKIAVYAGLVKGVPDLFLDYRTPSYSGLRIELKVGKNTTSPEQAAFLGFLLSQGFYAVSTWGFDETTRVIEDYINARL